VTATRGIELGAQLGWVWNCHVRRVQEASPSGLPLRVGIGQPTIDGLAHDRGDRYAAFLCSVRDAPVTLVVDQNLKAMLKWHEHTLA
jgi:hypothetical protein